MNNNSNEKPSFWKGKGAAAAVVICFVAVIAGVGAYTFNNYQNNKEQQIAKTQEEETKENTQTTTTDDIVLPETETDTSDTEEETENDADESTADTVESETGEADNTQENAEETQDMSTSVGTSGLWFDENSLLEWPASGATLIGYSMDQTVYFSTLEQYKYNPALVISGEVGEEIGASAPGIVSDISQTAQTGTTVTLDMGNGYTAVYGQLKEVPLAIGDYVGTGELVGYLSEPTKYYSVEGPNLYFKVMKDGEPVNPLDFMEG